MRGGPPCKGQNVDGHGSCGTSAAMRKWIAAAAIVVLAGCGRERPPEPVQRAPAPPPAAGNPRPKVLDGKAPVPAEVPPIARDLPQIAEDKTLRVLFTFNSTGYFVYRGETMGYEYELLSRFAKEAKLKLVPVVVRDSSTLIDALNKGEGDVIAAQLVAPDNEKLVLLTNGLYATSPVVVQRRGEDAAKDLPAAVGKALAREERETELKPIEIRARLVSIPEDLAGQQVHLAQSSPYRRRLLELDHELGDDIEVVEIDESTDRLIQRLSGGEIAFTVAPENLAALKTGDYTNLLVKPAIGPPQQVVWAVRRNAPALHDTLNRWLDVQRKSGLVTILYRKFFLDRRGFHERAKSRYLTAETGRLSPYDDWFREYARIPGWDWRLVASQAYQESRFKPAARSWAGAAGVMQIMPRTARELRVNPNDPRQSIEGGCRYLWKLDQHWQKVIPQESERRKFILASYNVGTGHVEDARRLAKKFGDDADDWDDVAYWLIRKSKRAVYNDPVVKYGYARGTEPVTYVELIFERFEHYKQFVKPDLDEVPEPAVNPETARPEPGSPPSAPR